MAASHGQLLIQNGSATSAGFDWPGGDAVFVADGTFGGCTVALQIQLLGGTWINTGVNTTLTAPGAGGVTLPPCQIRASVTGGSPSALNVALARVVR